MRYARLGRTGLQVSTVVLGAAQFGDSVDVDAARGVVSAALDCGITTFDTGDAYAGGRSEGVLAAAIPAGMRDSLVLCTKVGLRVGDDDKAHAAGASSAGYDLAARWQAGIAPTDHGLSRKHILQAVEASLRRLDTDYLDLYQVHRFDATAPLEETLSALDDLVRSGKVRYIGCSAFAAWQLCRALWISEVRSWESFASMQVRYSVIERAAETEVLPACEATSVGVLAFQALAGGVLASPPAVGASDAPPPTSRAARQSVRGRYWNESVRQQAEGLRRIAADLGRSPVETALGWVLGHPAVAAVVVGASRPDQLAPAVCAADQPLTGADRAAVLGRLGGLPAS